MRGRLNSGVALVLTEDRIDGVEDRDVDNGHGAAGAAGAKLFAKRAMFALGNRRMIQAGSVDGDLVPVVDGIAREFFGVISEIGGLRMKQGAVSLTKTAGGASSKGGRGDGE